MIKELLINKTGIERANIKSEAIAKLVVGKFTDDQYGVEVEIKSIEKIEGGIQLYARAWKGTKQLGFGADGTVEWERFRIFNPPIMVPDGTKKKEIIDGKEVWVSNFKEDLLGALRETLADIIKINGRIDTKVVSGSFGHTVSTFYPDPSPGTTSISGRVINSGANGEPWATTRGAADGTSASDAVTQSTLARAVYLSGTNRYIITRGFFLFDTSPITDTDTISAGVLTFFAAATGVTDTDTSDIDVVASTPASNTAIAVGDFDQVGTTVFASKALSAWVDTDGTGNDFTLNASGIAAISKTSITKFGTRNSRDTDDSAPTGENDVSCYYASEAGTTKDPKLVVTHAAAASGPANLKSLNTNLKANIKSYNTNLIANIKSINTNS